MAYFSGSIELHLGNEEVGLSRRLADKIAEL